MPPDDEAPEYLTMIAELEHMDVQEGVRQAIGPRPRWLKIAAASVLALFCTLAIVFAWWI